jgi:hypothetical protein
VASKYVQVKTQTYTLKIRNYINNEFQQSIGNTVSPIWRTIFNDLQSCMAEIGMFIRNEEFKPYPKQKDYVPHSRQLTPVIRSNGSTGTLPEKQYDSILNTLVKLFDERLVYVPTQIKLNQKEILSSIVKCIFKVSCCSIEPDRRNTSV